MSGKLPALFDVNGCYGNPCKGESEFRTIKERLAHMDRLGVSRSLVWNTETIQHHAPACNRDMLEDIAGVPEAAGRILPAIAISSLSLYEKDGLDELKEQFGAMPCRALRFVNAMERQTLMQLAPLIRELRSYKPFLVFNHRQVKGDDLLAFGEEFPDVPMVMAEAMWPQQVILFDLMRRCKSLLCDISWMHTFESIELVVKHFGAERLVFGLGNRTHQGAAIAPLMRAEITEEERLLIEHGNLDRLTGLSPTPEVETKWESNTLWPAFLSGGRLEVDIVDAHGHLGPSSGYVMEAQEEEAQLEVARKSMEKIGIRTFIVSGMQAIMGDPVRGNKLLGRLLRPHAGVIDAYFGFNPLYADKLVPMLEESFANPAFVGFKTLCSYWQVPITDERFQPMWEFAQKHRLPVLSHSWALGTDNPALFYDLAKSYPEISFLLGHSGGTARGRLEAAELARECSNVYLEWCGSFCNTVSWEETLASVGAGQIVFGTDAMAHSFEWELGRLLSQDFSDADLEDILGGNMRRILAMRRK